MGAHAPVRELVFHVSTLPTLSHCSEGSDGSGTWPLVHAVAVQRWPGPVVGQSQVALSARMLGGRAGHTAQHKGAADGRTGWMAVSLAVMTTVTRTTVASFGMVCPFREGMSQRNDTLGCAA